MCIVCVHGKNYFFTEERICIWLFSYLKKKWTHVWCQLDTLSLYNVYQVCQVITSLLLPFPKKEGHTRNPSWGKAFLFFERGWDNIVKLSSPVLTRIIKYKTNLILEIAKYDFKQCHWNTHLWLSSQKLSPALIDWLIGWLSKEERAGGKERRKGGWAGGKEGRLGGWAGRQEGKSQFDQNVKTKPKL